MEMWDTAERRSTRGFVRGNVTKAPGETARQIIMFCRAEPWESAGRSLITLLLLLLSLLLLLRLLLLRLVMMTDGQA